MAGSPFTVLVATDFSPTAEAATQWGAELARTRRGKVVIVHAVDLHGPLTDFLPSPPELDEHLQAAAISRLDAAAQTLRDAGVEVDTRLETGVAGIHGTSRPDLLGKAVSHGCIRVRNDVALRLKRLAPPGTVLDVLR